MDATDFGLFLAGYNDPSLAAELGWALGDYDYDGTVTSSDFGEFQAGYNYYQNSGVLISGGVQPVPEPGAAALAISAIICLIALRKRAIMYQM